MGSIHRSIPFFSPAIAIVPLSVSTENVRMLGKPTTIAEFADGEPVSLHQDVDSGEYIVATTEGRFMRGPEAPPPGYYIDLDTDGWYWSDQTDADGTKVGHPTAAAAAAAAWADYRRMTAKEA